MPKQQYVAKRFAADTLAIIAKANVIIEEYSRLGYDITLRQAYYQFIARDLFPDDWIDVRYNRDHKLQDDTKNTVKNYKRLGSIIADARLAGLIDWNAIVDRTRNTESNSHWSSPGSIIESAAASFALDKWNGQPYRPIVLIEKDALSGILASTGAPLDVEYASCRGYNSISALWLTSQQLIRYRNRGQTPHIFYLGDHDPSGIDMSRDIQERLRTFGASFDFTRLALNRDQVDEYQPPANPAKATDARFRGYQQRHGDDSWELDALDPVTLTGLISDAILSVRDDDLWEEMVVEEDAAKATLRKAARHWDELAALVGEMADDEEDD